MRKINKVHLLHKFQVAEEKANKSIATALDAYSLSQSANLTTISNFKHNKRPQIGKEKRVEADGDASPTLVLPNVNRRFALAPKMEKNGGLTTYNEPMVVVKSPRRIKQR